MTVIDDESWIAQDEVDEEEPALITDYDILTSPNDWNVLTIANYMEAGAIQIPYFQRNYIWDLKRASKLIESLIIGLPVPQLFLYEEERNSYLVIDGQQRLLSIYFFVKGRFPRPGRRGYLRQLIAEQGLDASALADSSAFQEFRLNLSGADGSSSSPFHRLKYEQLGDYKSSFDLRTLRNVVIKQVSPGGHDAMYEVFNRLNSGGMNLTPQEIRASLYRSHFMRAIYDLNLEEAWRHLLGKSEPDNRMKDVEVLIRATALSSMFDEYKSPMTTFLNNFSRIAQSWRASTGDECAERMEDVIRRCLEAGPAAFQRGGKFSPLLFEAVAVHLWENKDKTPTSGEIETLSTDKEFVDSLQEGSTKTLNVTRRIAAAKRILGD
jgi:hypothetical protein